MKKSNLKQSETRKNISNDTAPSPENMKTNVQFSAGNNDYDEDNLLDTEIVPLNELQHNNNDDSQQLANVDAPEKTPRSLSDTEQDFRSLRRFTKKLTSDETRTAKHQRRLSLQLLFPGREKEYKLMVFVLCLFCVIVACLITIYYFHQDIPYYVYHGENFILDKKTLRITVLNASGDVVLRGNLWQTRNSDNLPYDCSQESQADRVCLEWSRSKMLEIVQTVRKNLSCYRVEWTTTDASTNSDCFHINDALWFGGGVSSQLKWPINKMSLEKRSYVIGTIHDQQSFGSVLSRFWLSSKSVSIAIDQHTSLLSLSINAKQAASNDTDQSLCLFTDASPRPSAVNETPSSNNLFVYNICVGRNVEDIQERTLPLADRPEPINTWTELLHSPVWSTWSYLKENLTSQVLQDYVTSIAHHKYGHSILMIDDGWEERYGDFQFKISSLSNTTETMHFIHSLNFSVSLVVHVYVSSESKAFQNSIISGYLVKDDSNTVPRLVKWWNGPHTEPWSRGVSGILNTNNDTLMWYRKNLDALKTKYHVDYFHLRGDAGYEPFQDEPKFLLKLNNYVQEFVRFAGESIDFMSVGFANENHDSSVIIRMSSMTEWEGSNGLQGLIPSILSIGLAGYPLFIPDCVGGSAFSGWPSKELYIRWLQVSVFLPIMHLSIPPDLYGNDTVNLFRELMNLRRNLVQPIISDILEESNVYLRPIVRPLWSLDPTDEQALSVADQFLVGDSLMVAPMLNKGTLLRNIYVPIGTWTDQYRNIEIEGGRWLIDYPVPLTHIPYFIRI